MNGGTVAEDGAHPAGQNFGFTGACYFRRCSGQNNNVTYGKRLSNNDDAFSSLPKRSREGGSFCATEEQNKEAASEEGLLRSHRPSTSAAAASDVEKENPIEENLLNGNNENETHKENGKEADGYTMVFKAAIERGLTVTLEIPHTELLRFSHQVPAFRLTVGNKGSSRGCWELGPASLMRRGSFGGFSEAGASTHQDDENETHTENGKNADVVDDSKGRSKPDGDSKSIHSPKTMPDPEFFYIPDPDFSNFDQLRELEKFAVDQIWAIYDTVDAMPRFYARVRKILSPGFYVRITWLEPITDDQNVNDWVEEDLPYGCGSFKNGKTENTLDQLMFSHVMTWEKGNSRGSYKIYPRMGETWALFKDWHVKWSSDPENHQKYEYEFVEVLSDYSEDSGISVVYLGRMKGFVSLFRQITKEGICSFQIPTNELLRFSHRIPSFRMTGMEREDVPEGSYELDPACLPTDIEVDAELDNGSKHSNPKFSKDNAKPLMESRVPNTVQDGPELDKENGLERRNSENSNQELMELNVTLNKFSQAYESQCAYEKAQKHLNNVKNGIFGGSAEASVSTRQDDVEHIVVDDTSSDSISETPSSAPSSSSEPVEIPETEFYDFLTDKTSEKLTTGEIWALYCDSDGMPKFYGKIKKIKPEPDFKVCVTWLEPCSLQEACIQWTNEDMPVCCGVFKPGNDTNEYDSTSSFSHRLKASLTVKNRYEILPRKGEVWALYKNWNAEWTVADLPDCKYDVVEILERNNLATKVQVLVLVDGYKTVYKAAKNRGSTVTLEIPHTELLSFSHQVPAFQLTVEKKGSLRGCWELDPASLPDTITFSKLAEVVATAEVAENVGEVERAIHRPARNRRRPAFLDDYS